MVLSHAPAAAPEFIQVCPFCSLVYRSSGAVADCPDCAPALAPGLTPLAGVPPTVIVIGNPVAASVRWARGFKEPS